VFDSFEAFNELHATVEYDNLSFDRLKQAAQKTRDTIEAKVKVQEAEKAAHSTPPNKQLQETDKLIKSSSYVLIDNAIDFAQKNNFALVAAKETLKSYKA
jgi:hypothetical protein